MKNKTCFKLGFCLLTSFTCFNDVSTAGAELMRGLTWARMVQITLFVCRRGLREATKGIPRQARTARSHRWHFAFAFVSHIRYVLREVLQGRLRLSLSRQRVLEMTMDGSWQRDLSSLQPRWLHHSGAISAFANERQPWNRRQKGQPICYSPHASKWEYTERVYKFIGRGCTKVSQSWLDTSQGKSPEQGDKRLQRRTPADPSYYSSLCVTQSAFSKCEPKVFNAARCPVWCNAVALPVATRTFLAELVHHSPEGPSGDPGPSRWPSTEGSPPPRKRKRKRRWGQGLKDSVGWHREKHEHVWWVVITIDLEEGTSDQHW